MKIALFHNLPSGGAKRHTFEQVRELNLRGHQITEFAPDNADQNYCSFSPYVVSQRIYPFFQKTTNSRRIPFLTPYINMCRGIELLTAVDRLNRQIAKEIDEADFELVLVKDCHFIGNPYILKYLNTLSLFQCHHGLRGLIKNNQESQESKISLIESIKKIYYSLAKEIYDNKFHKDESYNIKCASRVITNSKFSVSLIHKHYDLPSNFIYPGIKTEQFKPIDIEKENFILSVGSLNYYKGYRFLIQAMSKLPLSNRPALFIAANTRDPKEEEIIRTLAVNNGVKLIIEKIFDDLRINPGLQSSAGFCIRPYTRSAWDGPTGSHGVWHPGCCCGGGWCKRNHT